MRIGKNTVISHEQAGGGGYGDPKQRDRALVREDIADEKISAAYARRHYGI
jgi:N-methylhydantoinase B